MRVCLVSSSFYPATSYGGPIFATWGLSRNLAAKGIKIYVSTTNANGRASLENVITNKHVKLLDNLWVRYYKEEIINFFSFSMFINLWNDIRKSDIVYIQYLFHYTVLFSVLYSWFLNKKVVVCPRGSFSSFTLNNRRSLLKSIWLKLIISPFAKRIKWHASSYLEKKDISSYFKKATVFVVNDGVDVDSFREGEEMDNISLIEYFTGKRFHKVSEIICSLGRLHKIKAYDVLIHAFSRHVQENPDSKLIIAGGDDGEKSNLNQLISDLDLSESVFLIGMVDEEAKRLLLHNSTFFALASNFESFGIVVAEALACGLPVIVSDKTPWRDVVKNNCGILAENKIDNFYYAFQSIRNISYNKDICRNYVLANFDWKVVTGQFVKHFLKIE